jgi:ankyrin repeat protein
LLINRGESIERAIGEHAVATYAAGLLLQSKELYDAFVAHRLVDPRSATAYGGNIFHACPVQFTGDISFDKAAVEAATAAGAFVNAKDSCGDTPLHVACRLVPSHTWLHMLLANDANPNAQDKNGYTPLGLPAYSSTAQSVSLLLKFGAKWNVPLCNTEPRTILENCLMKEEVWLFKAAVLAGPVILRRLCDDAEASANKLRITVPSIIAKLRDNPANARVQ